ncbi:MAG TPA: amino acid adenylation domain-containing protein [Pyrinomonadaceae bacterium]|nr:amino acid adenylation domain-containing protein [Pyrinomonadaceae bacterium]
MIIEGFALSPQQKRLWLLRQRGSDYYSQCTVLIEGELDKAALREALEKVVVRHEILRTTFHALPGVDIPIQAIKTNVVFDYREADFSDFDAEEQQAEIEKLSLEDRQAAWKFDDGPLARFSLITLSNNRYVLVATLPSLCADGWSLKVLVRDLSLAYAASYASDDEVVQYADFSAWQTKLLESDEAIAAREYWRGQIQLLSPVSNLPFEKSDDTASKFDPSSIALQIPPDAAPKLFAISNACDVSAAEFLLACWQTLLWKLTRNSDIVTGFISNGRRYEPLQTALGLYAKSIPFHTHFENDFLFSDVLKSVSRAVRDLHTQEDCFLWNESVSASEDPPFFSGAFEYEDYEEKLESRGVCFSLIHHQSIVERFKLSLSCVRLPQSISLFLRFDAARFDRESVELLSTYFSCLLESAVANPELPLAKLDILGPDLTAKVLLDWNNTDRRYPDTSSIHQLLEDQARQSPERIAVKFLQQSISFSELNASANRLAHHLISKGAQPEARVVLFLERSIDMISSLWAVWKSGAALVPLDVTQPRARLKVMLDQANPSLIVTHRELVPSLPDTEAAVIALDEETVAGEISQCSAENSHRAVHSNNLAYLIFTSGSTGLPKAAMVEHHSVVNLLQALNDAVYEGQKGSVTLNGSLAFDGSIKQVIQLAAGHTLVIVPDQIRVDGKALIDFLREEELDVLETTPSQLNLLLDAGLLDGSGFTPSKILVGGEAIDRRLWQQINDAPIKFFNLYGPTECTVDATTVEVSNYRTTPVIGKPLPNVRLYVLDSTLSPVPIGVPGVLFIAGVGVGRGYFERPELTAEKFLPDPFAHNGARMYCTADVVKYLADGSLVFVGRADRQVKVRANRVEPGEIEAVLLSLPEIKQAVVVPRQDASQTRLIAYFVPADQENLDKDDYVLDNGMSIAHQNREETDALYEEIFLQRGYERGRVAIPAGDTVVIDVGANIGMFTLYAASRNPRAKIYAIEPIPDLCEKLRENVRRYAPDAAVRQFAMAHIAGVEEFTFYSKMSVLSSMSKFDSLSDDQELLRTLLENEQLRGSQDAAELLQHSAELFDWRLEASKVVCPVKTVSQLIAEENIQHVGLLKIDVQRAEIEVLRGINNEDWSKIDQIVIEVHDKSGNSAHGKLAVARRFLQRKGYRVEVEQEDRLAGTDRFNLYCVRNDVTLTPAPYTERLQLSRPAHRPSLTSTQLKLFLKDRLPEYMIPAHIVKLKHLPLNQNGKVDIDALPDPNQEPDYEPQNYQPWSAYEEIVAGIWEDVLDVKVRSTAETFFDLGGHSLLAARVASRARDVLKVELPLRTLFEKPSLGALAAEIEILKRLAPDQPLPEIVRVQQIGPIPLSFGQQRLWFLDQLQPGSNQYNSWRAILIKGALDQDALKRAITEIVRRHEVLRTTYRAQDGVPVQEVLKDPHVEIQEEDLRGEPDENRESMSREIAREYGAKGFNLETGPVMRVKLIKLREDECVLVMVMHHIVSDAWSLSILTKEVAEIYQGFRRGEESPLEDLKIQYADYANWQRSWIDGERLQKQLLYWTEQLGGSLPELVLPTDKVTTGRETSQAAQHIFIMRAEIVSQLRALSRKEGATMFMMLLAAFKILLHHYSGQHDITVGTPVANRNRAELEGLIGFFVNILAFRTDLSGNPEFIELLDRVREVALAAYAHQDVPFERIVEALRPERSLARSPLFQTTFTLQNSPMETLSFPDLKIELLEFEVDEVPPYDFMLDLMEYSNTIAGVFRYRKELFDPRTVARIARRFNFLLEQIVLDPQARLDVLISSLAAADRQDQIGEAKELRASRAQKLRTARRRMSKAAATN